MDIVDCPQCKLKVIPKRNGKCPGCRMQLVEPESAEAVCDSCLKPGTPSSNGICPACGEPFQVAQTLVSCHSCGREVYVSPEGTCSSCRCVIEPEKVVAYIQKTSEVESQPVPEPDWSSIESDYRSRRRRGYLHSLFALLLSALSVGLVVVSVVTSYRAASSVPDVGSRVGKAAGPIVTLAMCGILGPMLYGASHQINAARRAMQRDARLVLRDDRRPPVIYLRSFIHDASRQSSTHVAKMRYGIPLYVFRPSAHEMRLASVLKRIGPVVAIGQPGEDLPDLGAYRLYVENDYWKAEVLRLVNSAKLVVIRVGPTLGTYWEIVKVFRNVPCEKIILYFEPKGVLPSEMKPFLPPGASSGDIPVTRILWFRNDGTPLTADNIVDVLAAKGVSRRRWLDNLISTPCETAADQKLRDVLVWISIGSVFAIFLYFLTRSI